MGGLWHCCPHINAEVCHSRNFAKFVSSQAALQFMDVILHSQFQVLQVILLLQDQCFLSGDTKSHLAPKSDHNTCSKNMHCQS